MFFYSGPEEVYSYLNTVSVQEHTHSNSKPEESIMCTIWFTLGNPDQEGTVPY